MIKYKTQKIFLARRPTVYNRQLLRSYPAFPGLGLPVEQAPSSHLWTSNAPLSTDPLAGPGAGLLDLSAFAVGAPLWLGFWFGGMVYFLERGRLSSLERGGCPLWNGENFPFRTEALSGAVPWWWGFGGLVSGLVSGLVVFILYILYSCTVPFLLAPRFP